MVVSTPACAIVSDGICDDALEHVAEIERAERPEREQDADGEGEVAQARGDERFLARRQMADCFRNQKPISR